MQDAAEAALSQYSTQVTTQYEALMAAKLGLQTYNKDIAVGLMSNMYEDSTGTPGSCCSCPACLTACHCWSETFHMLAPLRTA